MQLKKREAESIFKKLQVRQKKSKHHVAGWVEINGKKILPIHYSFGKGDMSGRVADKFRKSLRLDISEFIEFKSCKMSRDEYVAVLSMRIGA